MCTVFNLLFILSIYLSILWLIVWLIQPVVDKEKLLDLSHRFDHSHYAISFLADIEYAMNSFINCQTQVDDMDKGIGMHRKDMRAIHDTEVIEFVEFLAGDFLEPNQIYTFLKYCIFNS